LGGTSLETNELIEDLCAAIPKIPNEHVRHAIEDYLLGWTLEKSAEERHFSTWRAWTLQQQSKHWLRQYLLGD
jgi:hypothetical protein